MQDPRGILPSKKDMDTVPKGTIFLLTYAVILIVALLNMNTTMSFIGWLLAMFTPFFIGLCIAFILNIIVMQLENRVFAFLNKPKYKLWPRVRRMTCLVLAILFVLLIIAALLFFIVPQLISSFEMLARNIPSYVTYLQNLTYQILDQLKISSDQLDSFALDWNSMLARAGNWVANVSPQIFTVASGFTNGMFNFFMGVIFAMYLLLSKEKLLFSFKKVLYAFLPKKAIHHFYDIAGLANRTFTNFVVGQLTEAVILGAMYFIGTSIFRMPYAPLISSLMAVCSLIPLFGPILGTVPSAFILLMVDPKLAIIFVVMAIVFQQVEGNFIYPRVVGNSIGLPGMWVLLSLLVGGYLIGGVGMILAVPVASVLYSIFRTTVNRRLKERQITDEDLKQ